MLNLTLDDIASRLGLTFQQIQKYESGFNRISASKLYELSQVLNIPINYFFDGITSVSSSLVPTQDVMSVGPYIPDSTLNAETIELLREFYCLPSRNIRLQIVQLIKGINLDMKKVARGTDEEAPFSRNPLSET